MDKYLLAGGRRLEGKIRVSGAKNAILPILAATLLAPGLHIIHDVPHLRDISVMRNILHLLGAVTELKGMTMTVNSDNIQPVEVPETLMREMRATVFLMGPLLGRLGKVKLSHPGGCAIGSRPINWHLKGLEHLGVRIGEKHGYIEAEAKKIHGAEIHLDFPSVGATENLMMAATLAPGVTLIRNAAREPEIADLQNFLRNMGARIQGAGTDVIRIDGVTRLTAGEYRVIPDRIEAGTFMLAGAITRGDVTLENVVPEHLAPVIAKMRDAGVDVTEGEKQIRVKVNDKIHGVDIKTLPHPGFPTDLQAPMISFLTLAEGTSVITENIFENRFKYVDELRRMGADIQIEGRVAIVRSVGALTGAMVSAPDLRGGAALVLAGLAAEGETVVDNIYHIDRGYDSLEKKLAGIGALVRRV
ncbi:MAG TPA: UDP-N-acetylglucosamine 1-carboxyvinyltransferase [Negativicutes bacterium]|nr:UDP-N-acetylglucosamine 1-carboxyvinyltransferase [Negativicutes bacterium]